MNVELYKNRKLLIINIYNYMYKYTELFKYHVTGLTEIKYLTQTVIY